MKKIIALIMAVAVIASLGVVSSLAVFDDVAYPSTDLIEEEYDFTAYATSYEQSEGPMTEMWFESKESYLIQKVEFYKPASGISIGCGTETKNTYTLNISIYAYKDDVATSVEAEPIQSGSTKVFYSSMRNSLIFDEVLPEGEYVLKLTCEDPGSNFWVGSATYTPDMAPSTGDEFLCNGITNALAQGTISYKTFLAKDYVAPETTEAPETSEDATEAPVTEAPTEEPTEAPATAPTEAPAEEEKGCNSVITGGAAIAVVMATAFVFIRKKNSTL